jgi:hypothetical protein
LDSVSGQISGQTETTEKAKTRDPIQDAGLSGGDEGTRTPDPLHTKQKQSVKPRTKKVAEEAENRKP